MYMHSIIQDKTHFEYSTTIIKNDIRKNRNPYKLSNILVHINQMTLPTLTLKKSGSAKGLLVGIRICNMRKSNFLTGILNEKL